MDSGLTLESAKKTICQKEAWRSNVKACKSGEGPSSEVRQSLGVGTCDTLPDSQGS